MQWVGFPSLASAVALAGGLGLLTALSQPSPDALRQAIKETRKLIGDKPGRFGVNITLLPSITPPDYAGYVKAAMDEGIDVFETAGNNREWRKYASGDCFVLTRLQPAPSSSSSKPTRLPARQRFPSAT